MLPVTHVPGCDCTLLSDTQMNFTHNTPQVPAARNPSTKTTCSLMLSRQMPLQTHRHTHRCTQPQTGTCHRAAARTQDHAGTHTPRGSNQRLPTCRCQHLLLLQATAVTPDQRASSCTCCAAIAQAAKLLLNLADRHCCWHLLCAAAPPTAALLPAACPCPCSSTAAAAVSGSVC